MASYIGKHASLYDLFYEQKDYAQEASFVHECLIKFAPLPVNTILELAGGTGKHASYLSQKGYEILVTDYSQDMLDRGILKYTNNDRLSFKLWDMSHPHKFNQQFDAAICLFDAIGYVQTNEKIISTLKNVYNNIIDKGIFICEFWNAGAMLRNYEPYRVKRFKENGNDIIRISETKLDYSKQTATVDYTIIISGKETEFVSESQTNRFFLIREMDNYLQQSGFKALQYFAGYQNDSVITADTWHTVVVAQKGIDQI